MALKSCKECGGQVSSKADKCPHCGAKIHHLGQTRIGCGSILVLVILGIILVGVLSSNQGDSGDEAQTYTAPPQVAAQSNHDGLTQALRKYGKKIADSTEGALKIRLVRHTETRPLNAYQIVFWTDAKALMSEPGAKPKNEAYLHNAANTAVWQVKFCTNKLKTLMTRFGADMVSGELDNKAGKVQSMAVCYPDSD